MTSVVIVLLLVH